MNEQREAAPPPMSSTKDFDLNLNRVGSHLLEQPDTDRSPTSTVDSGYGSLASVGRLLDEVDDITQRVTTASLNESSTYTLPLGPSANSRFYPNYLPRDSPVYTSWQPRTIESENDITPSLDDLLDKRKAVGSSLAPQSSKDGSIHEEPRPVIASIQRPGHDRPILPAKPPPVPFQHLSRPQEVPIITQPKIVHVPQPQPQIAPRPLQFAPQNVEDYGCSECGKVFNRKSDLVHHKRYHTRNFDRPYKCDECGQGFIHYKDLARHMPRHTGQRSFQCPFSDCDKTYTRKDNLNRHVRHDHAADPNAPLTEDAAPQSTSLPLEESKAEVLTGLSKGTGPSLNGDAHYDTQARESTPSSRKRSIDEVDTEKPSYATKVKRQPKEKWAHRLGCPFRKCKPESFTTMLGFRVCVTTPHEFTIRLLEHLKRNHDIFVCGDCFLAFSSPEYLTQHKSSHVHCGECYLSFSDKTALAAHVATCVSVDSSTQEHVWQILYETICSDGVRHNPVFGEDEPVEQKIEPNNLQRMKILSAHPAQAGQVPSLYKQPQSSTPSSTSGNGSAPPVSTADQRERQHLASAGAWSTQNGFRTNSIEARNVTPQASPLQGQLSTPQPILNQRIDFTEQGITTLTASPVSTISDELDGLYPGSLWLFESREELDLGNGGTISYAPTRAIPMPVLKSSSPPLSEVENFVSAFSRPAQSRHYCPSLTSESTAESQERFGVPADIPSYLSSGSLGDPNTSIKEITESFHFSWLADSCAACGVAVHSESTYCNSCCFGS